MESVCTVIPIIPVVSLTGIIQLEFGLFASSESVIIQFQKLCLSLKFDGNAKQSNYTCFRTLVSRIISMSVFDDQFVTLLAQSSQLIQQATRFLSCEDDTDNDNRVKCLQAISSSNDAMLGASETILAKKQRKAVQARAKQSPAMHFARSSQLVTFDNIVGSQDAKHALYENLVLPLSMSTTDRKKIFQGVLSGGGNVLLYGPPGTGKTCLAQAAACEANAELFSIRPSEILR
jgi:ATP-dependent 26S proteasome regulatory subunit